MTLLLYRLEGKYYQRWETARVFRPQYNKIPTVVERRRFLIFKVKAEDEEILNEDEAVDICRAQVEGFVKRHCKYEKELRLKMTYRVGNKLKTKVVWTRKGEYGDAQYDP